MLECESKWESMSVAAGVWWRDVLGGMIRGLGGYCSGGASREASSCGGKGLCLFASVRSVIEYTPLKVRTMEWSPDHGPGSPAVAAAEMVSWRSEMVGSSGAPCGGG